MLEDGKSEQIRLRIDDEHGVLKAHLESLPANRRPARVLLLIYASMHVTVDNAAMVPAPPEEYRRPDAAAIYVRIRVREEHVELARRLSRLSKRERSVLCVDWAMAGLRAVAGFEERQGKGRGSGRTARAQGQEVGRDRPSDNQSANRAKAQRRGATPRLRAVDAREQDNLDALDLAVRELGCG